MGGKNRPPQKFLPKSAQLFYTLRFDRSDPREREIAKYWVVRSFWPRAAPWHLEKFRVKTRKHNFPQLGHTATSQLVSSGRSGLMGISRARHFVCGWCVWFCVYVSMCGSWLTYTLTSSHKARVQPTGVTRTTCRTRVDAGAHPS